MENISTVNYIFKEHPYARRLKSKATWEKCSRFMEQTFEAQSKNNNKTQNHWNKMFALVGKNVRNAIGKNQKIEKVEK